MIIDERMATFIDSFATPDSPFLEKLEKYSIETNVPIIRKPMQSLIKFLLTLKAPENILEVGTAIGFSALLMAVIPTSTMCLGNRRFNTSVSSNGRLSTTMR